MADNDSEPAILFPDFSRKKLLGQDWPRPQQIHHPGS
jgi:hypothetical protein